MCMGMTAARPDGRQILLPFAGLLTAFDRIRCDLKGQKLASRLRDVNPKHQADACVFPSDVRLSVPQFDVSVSQLQDSYTVNPRGCKFEKWHKQIVGRVQLRGCLPGSLHYSHHSHVVFGLQRDLQQFGPAHHLLHAGRGDGLPCDTVDLVKGVWFQELLIRCADKDLEPQLICTLVPEKLKIV